MIGPAYTTKAEERIASLSPNKIYLLQEIFNIDKDFWKLLTKKQLSLLDFGKIIANKDIKEARSIFEAIIGPVYQSEVTDRIQSLSLPSIAILKDVITNEYKKCLTNDQLKALK